MNPRELDVLNILWKSEEPMMATDIVNAQKGLTQSTVTSVLRKLLKDEMVEVAGVTHSGTVLSRTYRPTEISKECILNYFIETARSFENVASPSEVCMEIIKKSGNKNEIKKLKSILRQMNF